MTAPAAPIHPSMSMAMSLHDLLQCAGDEALELIFTATERHCLIGGKSASLLRAGDLVALRDLDPRHDTAPVGGEVAVITAVRPYDRQALRVITTEHGGFTIPRSRLLVTMRG